MDGRRGTQGTNYGSEASHLVMTPLGTIGGKPVFWDSELEHADGTKVTGHCAAFHGIEGYRWPAPAQVYPEFNGNLDHLRAEYNKELGSTVNGALLRVADAALRHSIDAGQVVVPGEAVPGVRPFDPYTGRRRDQRDIDSDPMGILVRHQDEPLRSAHFLVEPQPDRDMAIAEAVRAACRNETGTGSVRIMKTNHLADRINDIDLDAIIISVKA